MDYLHSMAPSDEELLAFALDGEAFSETAREHLEHCEACQRRLARFEEANTFLVSRLYRTHCPTAMQLSFYCAGGLPGDERMSIANHLLDCPLCAAEAADARRFLQASTLEPLPSFSPRAALRRIFANLVKQQAQFVTRGQVAESAWPRQYHAESLDLSLHLSRASDGNYMLLGILTSEDPTQNVDAFEGMDVELYSAPGPLALEGDKESETPLLSTEVDDLGNLVFNAVPLGEYVMIIHLPDSELVIEGLTIEHG